MIDVPELPIGQRIKYYRMKSGKSQAALGGLVGRSEDWVSKVERGLIPVDRLSLLLEIGRVLGVSDLADLIGPAVSLNVAGRPEHPAVPRIRRALNTPPSQLSSGLPGEPLTVAELATRVAETWQIYETQTERYGPVGGLLPGLLAEAYLTVRTATGPSEEAAAARELVSLLHLHQVYLRRVGERRLSLLAADRAMQIADDTEDPALIAAAAWNVAGILVSSGDTHESLDLARSTIEHVRPGDDATPDHLSAFGALHLVGVIAAVRGGNGPAAWDLLREADRIAARLGTDRNDFHTAFGPTNVAMHSVHLAAEEGDAAEALRLADNVEVPAPGGVLPLERTTRYLVEVMHANRLTGDDFATIYMLKQIREASPEEIQYFPLVRDAIQHLLKRDRPQYRADLRNLAHHVGVLSVA
ncbi:helix-turn-helix domain-containing protein [Streptomyces marincola]|uniref:helix-turn-helix domain-containing protein n=1 Tax=Streptomyces marincola TaxID=2878388 RepID=UPI001CF1BD44|nr:helix-turn-helix transcriptional regulator [Streptomyces marincola]UCM88097.1 helix-turn-helix domain-containing protein [Streptomyces marincola]